MNLIVELKRRNVIRMAGLYLVGAWLVAQVAQTVLPAFEVPNWVMRATLIVLALGFVPALAFSWVFELTPEGIKRDEDVVRAESIAPQTARRMERLIIALLALAIAYIGFDKFVLAPKRDTALVAETTAEVKASTAKDQIIAAVLVMLGERTLALDFMERIAGNLGNNMDWAVMLPQLDPIRCEPRFIQIENTLKTHDPRRAAVCKGIP